MLKVEDITSMFEVSGKAYAGYPIKGNAATTINTIDGKSLIVPMTMEAVASLPCKVMPQRVQATEAR